MSTVQSRCEVETDNPLDAVEKAVRALESGEVSLQKASIAYSVPPTVGNHARTLEEMPLSGHCHQTAQAAAQRARPGQHVTDDRRSAHRHPGAARRRRHAGRRARHGTSNDLARAVDRRLRR